MSTSDPTSHRPHIKFVARALKKTVHSDGSITIESVDPSKVKPAPAHEAGFLSGNCSVTSDDLGAIVCMSNGCNSPNHCFGPYEDDQGNTYCTCM